MFRNRKFTAAAALSALVPTFFVNTSTGSDANNGLSAATAWQTLGKVNSSTFAAGNIIGLCGGQTFASQHLIVPSSGSVVARITFTSYGIGRAIIQPAAASTPALTIADKSYITVNNIDFSGAGSSVSTGWEAVNITSSSGQKTDITITNFNLTNFTDAGLYISGSVAGAGYANVMISNFVISGCAGEGLGAWSSSAPGVKVHNNITFQNGTISGSGLQGAYISATTTGLMQNLVAFGNGALLVSTSGPIGIWTFESTGVVIKFCESYNNLSGNSTDGGGFDIDGGCTNCIIEYCYSHGNVGAGYLLFNYAGVTWATNTVRYCISENDGQNGGIYAGITIGSGGTALTGIQCYNNTIFSNRGSGSANINVDNTAPTGHIANNIFYSASNTPLITSTGNPTSLLFTGNDYFATGTFSISWNSTTYTTFAAWQTATSQEKIAGVNVGLLSNPLLVSPGTGGTVGGYIPPAPTAYALQGGSPMIGAGLDLNAQFSINPGTQDYYGNAIPSGGLFPVGAHV